MDNLFFFDTEPQETQSTIVQETKTSQRYFQEPDPTLKCFNCNNFGHMSFSCPNQQKVKNCIFCASRHKFADCKEVLCHRCSTVGHIARACTAGFQKRCNLCKKSTHLEKTCMLRKDLKVQKVVKYLKCITCQKPGHLNCSKPQAAVLAYCHKCGGQGHNAALCPGKGKSTRDLFKTHVKLAESTDLKNTNRPMNKKEKRYWTKVENKAFKNLLKRAKRKNKHN